MIDTLMTHSISANTKYNAARLSHNSIQGHHHSVFEISYYADANQLRWSMTVGCLLDPDSPAARYSSRAVLRRPILGCGVLWREGGSTLVISDPHLPYHHQDAFAFLQTVSEAYGCTKFICTGDVFDHHAGSFHISETDALDPLTEYRRATAAGRELQKLFPKMVIAEGNHDRIPKRKLQMINLPENMIKNYNNLYDLDDGWVWTDKHKFDSKGAQPTLVPMTLNTNGRWNKKL